MTKDEAMALAIGVLRAAHASNTTEAANALEASADTSDDEIDAGLLDDSRSPAAKETADDEDASPAVYASGEGWESLLDKLAGLAVKVRTVDGSTRSVVVKGSSYPDGMLALEGVLWDEEHDREGRVDARYTVDSIRSIYIY